MLVHVFWSVNVSEIDYDRASHEVAKTFKIQRPELFPLCGDYKRVSRIGAFVSMSCNR